MSEAARWCALGVLLVPLGGLLKADLQAGETLLVSGATGNFGSAAVAIAIALGARVIAPAGTRPCSPIWHGASGHACGP